MQPVRIVLAGNPNVGKSAVFSRLTGADVIAANYPGTTVEYARGSAVLRGESCEVLDVPGTYSLEGKSRAERVAGRMTRRADLVINVVDATNLERNLNLTLDLLRLDVPMVVALNMWDEAVKHGVDIDMELLEEKLGVPVVPTCALSGEGIKDLRDRMEDARPGRLHFADDERWNVIGEIVESVQTVQHRHPTPAEKLSYATVHPVWGPLMAVVILAAAFEFVRVLGEGLIGYVFAPLFTHLWLPVLTKLSTLLGGEGLLHDILIGKLIGGSIDFEQSFGLLSTGLFIPFAAVMPYIVAFYLALSLLEDIGYLPRLGVLVDNVMHRLGLHGLSIIPMMLGLGCNVPGALGTRVLETRKERFVASTLMAVCVPCMAQIAVIAGLLGEYGPLGFGIVFGTLFGLWVVLGMVLKHVIGGRAPEILVDIPPYRFPYWKSLVKKLWMRIRWFLAEAIPYVLLGVLLVNILYALGIIAALRNVFEPIMRPVFGLPSEAIGALVVGFLRKDVAVGMLAPLGLGLRQLIVASVVLAAYFPCMATFVVLFRELGLRDLAFAAAIMLVSAFLVGGLLNHLLLACGL